MIKKAKKIHFPYQRNIQPTSCPTELLALTEMEQAKCPSAYFYNTFPPIPAKKQQLINSIHHGRELIFQSLVSPSGQQQGKYHKESLKILKWGHLEVHTGERIQGKTPNIKLILLPIICINELTQHLHKC